MREVILFIAMSLDGYIADSKGGVDWLVGQGDGDESGKVYSNFVKDVDTVLMGWNTYRQITEELSPGKWVYESLKTYVVTHRQQASSEKICFTAENPAALVRRLKTEKEKNIWICGGARLIRQLVREDAIDCYYLTVIPTILGSGIRLFETVDREIKLNLRDVRSYNGMTDLIYTRRKTITGR